MVRCGACQSYMWLKRCVLVTWVRHFRVDCACRLCSQISELGRPIAEAELRDYLRGQGEGVDHVSDLSTEQMRDQLTPLGDSDGQIIVGSNRRAGQTRPSILLTGCVIPNLKTHPMTLYMRGPLPLYFEGLFEKVSLIKCDHTCHAACLSHHSGP